MTTTIHGTAVLAGARAVLIRGPSGSGKSRLALDLIEAARYGAVSFARLVGDDRLELEAAGGRLLVRPAAALAGLIELRGVGIVAMAYEAVAVIGLVIDLGALDAERLPPADRRLTTIDGVVLPRLAVAEDGDALPSVLAIINSGGIRSGNSKWLDAPGS
jgi:serine kinase of HPr protein (carbohydrate metabolism regulator)